MSWIKRVASALLFTAGAFLTLGVSVPLAAQQAAPAQNLPIIRQITVIGSERVEPETIYSYLTVREGDPFDPYLLDQSLKVLIATGLFDDVEFEERGGVLVIRVVENPIINRIVFEGNKKLDRDDLLEEVRLRPRQVFTRAKVRADVQRMLQLYSTSGRFAAIIEPKVVQQEQNRVDLVFEIQEGPKSKVSRINFIGNKYFSDGDLKDVLATKESRWWKFFTSNDTFDPDRLAYDQQVLRQFYLNEGYADFRTISAVSELTPDREDFLITFTLEEGEIYEFGEIDVDSEIRDIESEFLEAFIGIREGQIYSAERIEQTIEGLTQTAGILGYAFVDISPRVRRDRENRKMNITFHVSDAPRVYVERINISGNVATLDRVVRREFRIQEGDAFNAALVTRSENRLNRLNFFREVAIEQLPGSQPDRIVLDVTVEDQATGQLNVGAGFSSFESFIFNFSIAQTNFLGKGQRLSLAFQTSRFRNEVSIDFTEPYLFGRSVAGGFNLFFQQLDNTFFNSGFTSDRYGFSLRAGASLNEFWTLSTRYTLVQENTSLVGAQLSSSFQTEVARRIAIVAALENDPVRQQEVLNGFDFNGDGVVDFLDFDSDGDGLVSTVEQEAGLPTRLRDSIGDRLQSILGYTIGFDTRNSFFRPTRGTSFFFSQDYAGLGGDVNYLRSTATFDHYWTPFQGWTLRLAAEGGLIEGIGENVRTNDRFFIGGPRIRGFDNSGIGPRDLSNGLDVNGSSLGGRAYYIGRTELFFPLGDLALESGIQASAFLDAGSLFGAQISAGELPECLFTRQEFDAVLAGELNESELPGSRFCLAGNSSSPRIAAGIGISWQSPFGPFRIDLARIIRAQAGDQTQTLQFNVGTTF